MAGNPYLDEYAQRQHLYGSPVGARPRASRRLAMLSRLRKMREEQDAAAASQAKYATGFPDATKPEPTDLERRMGAYQETWNRYLKDSATTPRAPSQDEMLAQQKMTNPLLVQQELDEESAGKEAWEEYWNAADKGVPEAIDALLPVTGQMWDAHRAEESQLDEARKFIGTLDPATQKDLIDQYDTALKSSWAEHQKRGKQIEEYSKRMDAAIARRAAGERERGAAEAPTGYFATIQDRLKDKALPSLAWFAHQLGRGQRMVAANLGYATDLLAGERDLWDTIKKMAPNTPLAPVGLFLDETQDRGELMNQQVKQAAGTYVAETEKDAPGRNFVRALYNPVGAGLVGTARTLASAEEGFDIAKAAVTGSEYIPAQTGAERREDWGGSAARLAFEIATDPGTLLPGVGSKVFAKVIKPIEPALDAMTRRSGIKATAKALRAITVGGYPLEDAAMAKAAITAKAAEIDASEEFILEAYKARQEVQAAWNAIPPEVQAPVREGKLAQRLIEEVPKKKLAGVVPGEADKVWQKAVSEHQEQLDALWAKRDAAEKAGELSVVKQLDQQIDDLTEAGVPLFREGAPEELLKLRRMSDVAERGQLAGEMRDEILRVVPVQHRRSVIEYAKLVEDKGALLKALSDERNLGVYDAAEGILEGYYARRWAPEFQQYLAQHPELTRELINSRANQFGERKTREMLYGEAEDLIRQKYKWTGNVWDPDEASVLFGDFIFAGKRAARNAETKNFLDVFGLRPDTQTSIKAVGVIDDAIRGFREEAAVAGTKAAGAEEAVSKLVAGRSELGKAASAQRRTFGKLETIADKVDEAGREGAAARAVAGEAKDLAGIKSPRLREVEEAFDSFRDELKQRMVGGLYTGGEVPPAITKAMRQLDDTIKGVRDQFFSKPRTLDDFAHFSEYQKAVLPKYRKALKEFSAFIRSDTPKLSRKAVAAIASDLDAAVAQLDRLDVVGEGMGRGVSAGVRERARRLAREAKEAASRADFHSKSTAEQIDVIKAELKRAGIRAPEGHMTALEFLDEFKVLPPSSPKFYDELVELATTYIPKSRVEEFRAIRHVADPGRVRQIINRITGWVARSVLATPASVAKDIKGQIINMAITDPNAFRYVDEAGRLILSGKADDDLAALIAAGLERPSFDQVITPSTIKATEEFGGGLKGRIAGAIEESGFTGGTIRGVGKTVGAVPGLGLVGRGVEALGRGVGKVGRASLNARQTTESVFRLATYKAAKARGLSRDEALREVAKWWGDFSQLSKLESNVLKGFVMFFSWQLRALKIGAAHLVDHPMRSRLFLSLAAGNVSDDPSFPEWARRQGGSIIGKDAQGNPRFMSLGAGSYFDPLNDILQGEVMQRFRTDGFSGIPKGLAQQTLRRLAPLAQAPIEYMTNYDSFSGGQIYLKEGQDTSRTRVSDHGPASALWLPEGLKKLFDVRPVYHKDQKTIAYIHVDPTWNWLFNKLTPGIGAELAGVNPLADPRKEPWEAAARALGFPTYSVRPQDVQKQVAMKVRTATEALRKEFPGSGLAMNEQGLPYFDRTSELGQQMAADNERWDREAKELGKNPDAYKRFKMGGKYEEALRLLDLAHYLDGWRKGIESEQEALSAPESKALEPLKRLAARQASKDQKPRRLRGRG